MRHSSLLAPIPQLNSRGHDRYVQAATDLAIAQTLAKMLRNGDIGGQKFTKVIGVGHSYGSATTQGLTATVPDMLDAVILQGFSGELDPYIVDLTQQTDVLRLTVNGSSTPTFLAAGAYSIATEVFPDRFSPEELTNGYLVTLAVSLFSQTPFRLTH